jgi:hypothetical protein
VIVTTRDLFTIPGFSKRPGFCRDSSRRWFHAHGLDWSAFVREGIEAEALEATGDGLALALVKWARQRAEQAHG